MHKKRCLLCHERCNGWWGSTDVAAVSDWEGCWANGGGLFGLKACLEGWRPLLFLRTPSKRACDSRLFIRLDLFSRGSVKFLIKLMFLWRWGVPAVVEAPPLTSARLCCQRMRHFCKEKDRAGFFWTFFQKLSWTKTRQILKLSQLFLQNF